MLDVAWMRIERGLFARLDDQAPSSAPPRRVSWTWLAVPAVVACALVFAATRGMPTTSPIVADEPLRVVAGASPSAVSFGDAHVALDANSALVMAREGDKPTAVLERGAAWFSVAPRAGRPPFVVLAGDTTVRVIGTRFRVARDGEHADVVVDHGIVEVRFRGSRVALTAGEAWSSDKPSDIASATSSSPPADPPSEPPSMRLTPDPTPAVVRNPAAASRRPSEVPAAGDSDRARYEALAKLEAKFPEAAIKGYLELSQGSGAWAANSLFAAARLAADRNDPRTATFLTIYLRRFPNGANVTDARELLVRFQGAPP
jgi:hypothetical protein